MINDILGSQSAPVALRKESVDRNYLYLSYGAGGAWSLSVRRAWIEIEHGRQPQAEMLWSLSVRRAWIEIASMREVKGQGESRSP